MRVGDLLQPIGEVKTGMNHTQFLPRDRLIYLGEELPWDDHLGMIGEPHKFPSGTTGIYLGRKIITMRSSGHRIFYKILTSDGRIGWLHESWVRKIK